MFLFSSHTKYNLEFHDTVPEEDIEEHFTTGMLP